MSQQQSCAIYEGPEDYLMPNGPQTMVTPGNQVTTGHGYSSRVWAAMTILPARLKIYGYHNDMCLEWLFLQFSVCAPGNWYAYK